MLTTDSKRTELLFSTNALPFSTSKNLAVLLIWVWRLYFSFNELRVLWKPCNSLSAVQYFGFHSNIYFTWKLGPEKSTSFPIFVHHITSPPDNQVFVNNDRFHNRIIPFSSPSFYKEFGFISEIVTGVSIKLYVFWSLKLFTFWSRDIAQNRDCSKIETL